MRSKIRITVFNKRGDQIDSFEKEFLHSMSTETVASWFRGSLLILRDSLGGYHAFAQDVIGNIKTEEIL